MKYILTVLFSIFILLFVLTGCGNSISSNANRSFEPSNDITAQEQTIETPPVTITESTSEHISSAKETTSQKNAVRTAKSYLDYTAFSRQSLIDQLEYEGYSNADAEYGVDHSGADWNEQAVKSAKSYLEYSAFSRQGLIEQLEYEGFTNEQAVYGVDAAGQ